MFCKKEKIQKEADILNENLHFLAKRQQKLEKIQSEYAEHLNVIVHHEPIQNKINNGMILMFDLSEKIIIVEETFKNISESFSKNDHFSDFGNSIESLKYSVF